MAANVVSGSIQVPGLTARKRDPFRRGGSLGVDALARALIRPPMSAPSAVAAQRSAANDAASSAQQGLQQAAAVGATGGWVTCALWMRH